MWGKTMHGLVVCLFLFCFLQFSLKIEFALKYALDILSKDVGLGLYNQNLINGSKVFKIGVQFQRLHCQCAHCPRIILSPHSMRLLPFLNCLCFYHPTKVQGVPKKSETWKDNFLKYENNQIWNNYEHHHVEQSFMCLRIFSCGFRSFH